MNQLSTSVPRIVRIGFLLRRGSSGAIPAAAIAPAMILTGCVGGSYPVALSSSASTTSSAGATVTISPQSPAVAINGSIVLTATVINSGSPPTWKIVSNPTTGGVGTLSSTSGYTVTYTAPATTPIYGPLGVTDLNAQSSIVITATPSANVVSGVGEAEVTITAPSVSTGIAPTTGIVHLGSTLQFYAYAVGDTDKEVTFEVNGVAGGAAQTGTITNLGGYLPNGSYQYWGLYTAPATMPTSGNTVTITAVSQADPSKSSSATVTLINP